MDQTKKNFTNDKNEKNEFVDIINSLQEDINSSQDENTFTIINDNGEEIKCEILFTYCDHKTGKNYIAYTDNTSDEDENTKVFASIFNPEEENPILLPIETDEEWAMIEKILENLTDDDYVDNEPNPVTKSLLDLLNED